MVILALVKFAHTRLEGARVRSLIPGGMFTLPAIIRAVPIGRAAIATIVIATVISGRLPWLLGASPIFARRLTALSLARAIIGMILTRSIFPGFIYCVAIKSRSGRPGRPLFSIAAGG